MASHLKAVLEALIELAPPLLWQGLQGPNVALDQASVLEALIEPAPLPGQILLLQAQDPLASSPPLAQKAAFLKAPSRPESLPALPSAPYLMTEAPNNPMVFCKKPPSELILTGGPLIQLEGWDVRPNTDLASTPENSIGAVWMKGVDSRAAALLIKCT